ncbi:hypothetical protein CK203_081359 [Vitis vinifera]|uniref:Retrotransposon gag domain-containing protein n=1 Tax=Vitis vinifera TaxID=29760 RepID=A0A438CZM1_VITVI|nr:hypothetical protein CK203_081359 [Vitis vinifera]
MRLRVKTIAAKQGSKTVTEYANQLKSLWQELDHYKLIKNKCPEDADILGKQEVPCFNEVATLIRGEESRRSVILEPQTLDGSVSPSCKHKIFRAMKNDLPKHLGRDNQWKENKDNLWCTYCKKPRHTKEKCWKLNGKPSSREWGNHGWQQRPQAHLAEQPKLRKIQQ